MDQPKNKYLAGKGTPPEAFQAAAARRLQKMNTSTAPGQVKKRGKLGVK